jgi:serine/threonine-protein kinase PRP4
MDSTEMSISPASQTNKRSRSRSPVKSIEDKDNKSPEWKKNNSESDSDDMFTKTPEAKVERIQIRLGGEVEDTKGYYIPQVGEVLLDTQNRNRYKIISIKGKGVYSCVVEVQNMDSGEKSAIKVLRNNEIMLKSGEKEIKILEKLNLSDLNDRRNIIRLQGHFIFQGHLCIKFEPMGMNLRELITKYGSNTGLSLEAVRSFARQGFIGLYHLRSQKIIHSDSNFYIVKPDNILISPDLRKIKISDLGSALEEGENKITDNLVARYYRPPEIYLGYPYDYSIDVWSFGCTLFELFTGKVLFPGTSDSHMIKLMMEIKGLVPKKIRNQGVYTDKYFDQFNFVYIKNESEGTFTIPITEIKKEKSLGVALDPVSQFIQSENASSNEEDLTRSSIDYLKELPKLQNLLEQCLELDPNERITPDIALKHPFLIKEKPLAPKQN